MGMGPSSSNFLFLEKYGTNESSAFVHTNDVTFKYVGTIKKILHY
jgi:hypothetical protein